MLEVDDAIGCDLQAVQVTDDGICEPIIQPAIRRDVEVRGLVEEELEERMRQPEERPPPRRRAAKPA